MTDSAYDDADPVPALGTVVEQGRGSLPFALIHGEALVTCAVWALGEAGVTPVDLGTEWAGLVDSGEAFVLHDSLCPMTPAAFIADCLRTALERDVVVVGVLPGDDGAEVVASPVVLPPSVVAACDGEPPSDFAALVEWLRRDFSVLGVPAPASAGRVASVADVEELERRTGPPRD
jgi:2-C-methyl-D-erythritol 4-phosphate cytidylyltransferase